MSAEREVQFPSKFQVEVVSSVIYLFSEKIPGTENMKLSYTAHILQKYLRVAGPVGFCHK